MPPLLLPAMTGGIIPIDCGVASLERLSVPPSAITTPDLGVDWVDLAAQIEWSDGTVMIVSSSPDVLVDGTSVRALHLAPYAEVRDQVRAAIPDIQLRAETRGSAQILPGVPDSLPPAAGHRRWSGLSDARVVIRNHRAPGSHRVACGLLFERKEGGDLLVAADPILIAMVVSDDPAIISAYLADCDVAALADYRLMIA